ncbi:MAG: Malate-2H(+)/Na(+)-lactate antiporter [Synergistaceae bacterium]
MEPRKPSLALTLALFLTVAAMIAASVLVWEVDIHITLILGAMLTIAIGVAVLKYDYATIEKGIIDGIMTGMQACLILYTVGPLIGTWILSGVVPTMIYYGLAILNPSIFLFATLLICSVVSLSTGTSWGTSGTVGIALMGIALGLGIPAPLTAGVVISGAYFGDKMSPLSDTTNLAPAVAGTDLFQHIRAMVWTTGPTYIIVAVITIVIGFRYSGGELDTAKIAAIQALMRAEFWINPVTLIAPLVVIGLSAARKPALPSLWAGIFVAIVIALVNGSGIGEILNIMQYGYVPTVSASIAGAGEDAAALAKILAESNITVAPDIALEAANDIVKLMERGGLQSMNWTISLIICAFTFGFAMETCGFLKVMLEAIMKPIKSVGGMITATIMSCLVCDIFLGDQYLSIAMPGTMFRSAYEEKGLHPRMLSRSLEDAGTLLSVLIPWNTCGAYHTTVLGVPTAQYIPYAFLNYLNPIVAIVLTYMGIGIAWKGKNGEPVISKTRPADLV